MYYGRVAQSRIWSAITTCGRGPEEGFEPHGFIVSFLVWFPWSESQGVPPRGGRLGTRIGEGEQLEAGGSRHFNSITKVSTNMSRLKIAGLALASMLVMGMAVTGSASAALLWLVCLEGSGLTKYESSTCLKAASGGKWQSLGVRTGTSITVKLVAISILLTDTGTALGEVVANCSATGSKGEGVIKPNGEGEITVAEYTNPKANCKDEKSHCTEFTKVKGANLPWNVKLFMNTKGETVTKIEPGSKGGQPGWEVTCKAILEITDTCTSNVSEEEEARLVNTTSATELLVTSLFQEARPAHCTQSGGNTGSVKGSIAILLPGGALSTNPV